MSQLNRPLMSIDTNYIPQHPDWLPLSKPEETTVKIENETPESEMTLVEDIKKITFDDLSNDSILNH